MLFEDLSSDLIVLPIFRAMKQNSDFARLWTLRSFFKVIFMLRVLVKHILVNYHSHIYLTLPQLLSRVYELFKDEIVDKGDKEVVMNLGGIEMNLPTVVPVRGPETIVAGMKRIADKEKQKQWQMY